MLEILRVWEQRCSSTISDLETQITGIRSDAAKRATAQKKREEVVDHAVLHGDDKDKKDTSIKDMGTIGSGKGKGNVGIKRDLDEQQEDDEYEVSSGDGGVGTGVARMEVDETMGGPRSSKRISGKKNVPGAWS